MKKVVVLLLTFLFLSIFSTILIKAQESLPPDLARGVGKLQNITEVVKEQNASYLAKEWIKILKENKVVSALDEFFTKNSVLFRIVFGMPYSLSLTLAFVIILWLFAAAIIIDFTRKGLGILEGFAWILGIVAAIVLAQLQILKYISSFLVKLIFLPESGWARAIVFVILVMVLVLIFYLKGGVSQALEEKRKKKLTGETEQSQKEIKKFTKGLEKSAGI